MAPKKNFLREKYFHWDWNSLIDATFHKCNQWICNTLFKTTLEYFDCTKPVVTQANASDYDLGAALLQHGRPITFASKILTDVET